MSGPADLETATGTHEVLDHPADVRLRLRAPDAPSLFAAALRGLHAVLTDNAPRVAATGGVTVDLRGSDPADLLVCLLNEALFQLEAQGLLVVGLEGVRLDAERLRGVLQIARPEPHLAEALLEVKAATYSELRWERTPDGALLAEITLDL